MLVKSSKWIHFLKCFHTDRFWEIYKLFAYCSVPNKNILESVHTFCYNYKDIVLREFKQRQYD